MKRLGVLMLLLCAACQQPQKTTNRYQSKPESASDEQGENNLPTGAFDRNSGKKSDIVVTMPEPAKQKSEEEAEEDSGVGSKILNKIGSVVGYQTVQKCPSCAPKKPGDIVHRESGFSSAYVGHAGLYKGNDSYLHVTSHGGEGETSMSTVDSKTFFTSKDKIQESYGAKRPKAKPDGLTTDEYETLVRYSQELMDVGTKYDFFHLYQKGKFFAQDADDPVFFTPGHFKYDCVGYVENIFESDKKGLNINLTPNDLEEGLGIPLTVREQRDSSNVINVGP